MHLKRNKVPRRWAIPRKGTKFVVQPNDNRKNGISILIVMRDMLKIAKTRKEAKAIIHNKDILVNNKTVTDEKFSVSLFDKINLKSSKKFYNVLYGKRKIILKEIPESEAKSKILKIVNKTILGKDKFQINLSDGRNFLTKEKYSVGDSITFEINENKIGKTIPIKKGSEVIIISGKHLGKIGKIHDMDEDGKSAIVEQEDSKININLKNLIVTK
ncbi:MAG: hypothetical protein KKF56_01415 [Nanoarchaeota archaeon]|nr:hypothetical protein [Nanoarchaeota archaeon]